MPRSDSAVRDGTGLSELGRERPELLPWLRPLGIALSASAAEPWRGVMPLVDGDRAAGTPALHGALIPIPHEAARAHVRAVLGAALGSDGRASRRNVDAIAVLEAGVAQDTVRLADMAADAGTSAESLAAAAQLAAVPLLLACARTIAPEARRGWQHRYCHVCGALPLLAEALGLDRARQLRCGRCGAAWQTYVLLCPFCGERDHAKLGSLIPDGPAGQVCHVETCATCGGYWKTRTLLRPLASEVLLLEDARSIELDIAATDRGFARPDAGAFTTRIRIAPAAVVS